MTANKRYQVTNLWICTSHLCLSTLLSILKIHLTKMTGRPMLSSLLRLGSKYRLSVMTFLSPTLRGLARQLPRRLAMLFFFKMKKVKQQNNTCWHTHLNGELVQGMTH